MLKTLRHPCFPWSRILSLPINSPVRAAVLAAVLRRALKSGLVSRSIFTAGRFGCLGEVPTHLKSGSSVSGWGSLVLTQAWPQETRETGELVPAELGTFKNKREDRQFYSLQFQEDSFLETKQSEKGFQCRGLGQEWRIEKEEGKRRLGQGHEGTGGKWGERFLAIALGGESCLKRILRM